MAYTNHNAVRGNNYGTHTATAAEATANAVAIDVSSNISDCPDIVGFIVQIFRAGINVSANADVSASGTTLTIATNGTDYVVTENDVINYIVF